jgi:hypothetical protein
MDDYVQLVDYSNDSLTEDMIFTNLCIKADQEVYLSDSCSSMGMGKVGRVLALDGLCTFLSALHINLWHAYGLGSVMGCNVPGELTQMSTIKDGEGEIDLIPFYNNVSVGALFNNGEAIDTLTWFIVRGLTQEELVGGGVSWFKRKKECKCKRVI